MGDFGASSHGNTDSGISAKKAHVLVLGNEKGGCGKTTTAMHLMVSLMRLGFVVGSIDIDARQRSLSRYLENRRQTALKEGVTLPQPQHVVLPRSPFNIKKEAEEDEYERFTQALNRLSAANDFVLVDSPGNDTYMSRLAHNYADTVITPINDSFVDLDVLATVDGQSMKIIKPSIYSEMIWEQKLQRAKRDGGSIEWIVMRNRLSNIDAKNKRFMTQVTTDLSRRIGFRVAPGFSERVIFREMFLQGLTVLDIMEKVGSNKVSMSHIAARQEVRDLLKTLQIPVVTERLERASSNMDAKKEEPAQKAEVKADANVEEKAETKTEPAKAEETKSDPMLEAKKAEVEAEMTVKKEGPKAESPEPQAWQKAIEARQQAKKAETADEAATTATAAQAPKPWEKGVKKEEEKAPISLASKITEKPTADKKQDDAIANPVKEPEVVKAEAEKSAEDKKLAEIA